MGTYNAVEKQGNIYLLTRLTKANRTPRVRRLGKDEYVDLGTGEVRRYEHADKRTSNEKSLRRTFSKIRALVNANSTEADRVKWLTLTYRENMTDPKRLSRDFDRFWKRLRYYHGKRDIPMPEYIIVAEPQERGAWHLHALLIYPSRQPFIPHDKLESLWGHGFIFVRAADKACGNLGAYLSSYLSDLAIEPTEGVPAKETAEGRKSVVKGARLDMYPPGMKIFRCSRGIKRPRKTVISEDAADYIMKTRKPTYKTSYALTEDGGNGFETVIEKYWFYEPNLNLANILLTRPWLSPWRSGEVPSS